MKEFDEDVLYQRLHPQEKLKKKLPRSNWHEEEGLQLHSSDIIEVVSSHSPKTCFMKAGEMVDGWKTAGQQRLCKYIKTLYLTQHAHTLIQENSETKPGIVTPDVAQNH